MDTKTDIKIPKHVAQLIVSALKKDQLSLYQLYVMMSLLRLTNNKEEMDIALRALVTLYPFLSEYIEHQEGEKKIIFEQEIQKIMPALIQKDPQLAIEIMKKVQTQKVTKDELVTTYPILKEYFN